MATYCYRRVYDDRGFTIGFELMLLSEIKSFRFLDEMKTWFDANINGNLIEVDSLHVLNRP
jgi:hypothetical protein